MSSPRIWNSSFCNSHDAAVELEHKYHDLLQQSKEDITTDQPHEKYPSSKSFQSKE